jgi:hypothetical protein
LAKSLVTDTTSQVTNTDAIIGTPLYMSPEQVEGKPTDQRSDLYSLGCILFELLAGAPPFQDASANLLLSKHVSAPPPPLPSHVPAPIRTVIERVLAKRPEDRLQTAGDVRTALQNAIDGGVLGAREPADTVPDAPSHDPALAMTQPPPEAPGSATGTASHAAAARSTTPPPLATAHGRSRRGAALVGAAALALASVAIGYQVVTRSREVPAPGAGSGSVVVVDSGALDPPTSPDAAPAAAPIDAPVVEPPPATVDARANERGRDRDRDRVRDRGNDGVRANWYGGDARVEAPAPDAVPARQSTPSPDAKPEIDFVRRKKPDARP